MQSSGYHRHVGLRETNAERTRQLIVDVAVDLFIEHGYDTTMEQIAEQAGVGSSTLYRFPRRSRLTLPRKPTGRR